MRDKTDLVLIALMYHYHIHHGHTVHCVNSKWAPVKCKGNKRDTSELIKINRLLLLLQLSHTVWVVRSYLENSLSLLSFSWLMGFHYSSSWVLSVCHKERGGVERGEGDLMSVISWVSFQIFLYELQCNKSKSLKQMAKSEVSLTS